MRQRNSHDQLLPLSKRRTEAQMAKREDRTNWRSTVSREHAMTRGMFIGFVRMGFWGRLKWLLRGV